MVDDNLPLHGSVELSNRKSQDTRALRAMLNLQYANLWQRGHSLSLSGQVAPEDADDAKVYYGSYLARFDGSPFSLLLTALRSDSNVSTIGGTNVIGNGKVFGVRGVWALEPTERLLQLAELRRRLQALPQPHFARRQQLHYADRVFPVRSRLHRRTANSGPRRRSSISACASPFPAGAATATSSA